MLFAKTFWVFFLCLSLVQFVLPRSGTRRALSGACYLISALVLEHIADGGSKDDLSEDDFEKLTEVASEMAGYIIEYEKLMDEVDSAREKAIWEKLEAIRQNTTSDDN